MTLSFLPKKTEILGAYKKPLMIKFSNGKYRNEGIREKEEPGKPFMI